MRKIKVTIKVLFLLILVIITIFNVCSVFNLNVFHFKIYKVITGSMEPYLKSGEMIIVRNNLNYGVGDVVTYEQNGIFITHRIVNIDNDLVVTRGDANNMDDSPINKKDIVGKVVCKFGILSFLFCLLEKPWMWLIFLFIGIIVIFMLSKYRFENGVMIDDELI